MNFPFLHSTTLKRNKKKLIIGNKFKNVINYSNAIVDRLLFMLILSYILVLSKKKFKITKE